MPMIDVYIPEGTLRPEAEAALLSRLTDLLMTWEGFDPADPAMRAVSWVFLHRPAAVYVAGAPADAPRYKIVPSVPEGQLNERSRAGVVADVTEAVLDAEEGRWPRDPGRVWVFPTEIPDGRWGGQGRVVRLADILTRALGDADEARLLSAERIAMSRAELAGTDLAKVTTEEATTPIPSR
jgi:phenylpyruvate tautomerase PptA (4-oxalocrotonate tautomerase family)